MIRFSDSANSELVEKYRPAIEAIMSASSLEMEVAASPTGLAVYVDQGKQSQSLAIDIDAFVKKQTSFPAAKKGVLNQAIGKRTKTILDASAGWAGDALLLCSQGYELILLERHPLMALFMEDAMQRLAMTEWAQCHQIVIPVVQHCDAIQYLRETPVSVDCVYFDPMFPPKRKKSAASNKYMAFLQNVVGKDHDSQQVVEAALASSAKRTVVKRPGHAQPILPQMTEQFCGKLVNYDVYIHPGA